MARVVRLTGLLACTSCGGSASDERGLGYCQGPAAMDRCLEELTRQGLGGLGWTREFVRACGDENPVIELLSTPDKLPQGRTRHLLETGLAAQSSDEVRLLSEAFEVMRRHADRTWVLAVEYANSCHGSATCNSRDPVLDLLRDYHTDYLSTTAAFLSKLASKFKIHNWIRGLGDPAHIVAKQAYAPHHLDLVASLMSSLDVMEPMALLGVLHDLSLRIASSNCEMQAQLLAHLTLSKLLPPEASGPGSSGLPHFEFHAGMCCRRWHVLSKLVAGLEGDSRGRPLHVVEVGVNNAVTSEYLLSHFPDLQLDGIDPYIGVDAIHEEASKRFARFGGRARLARLRSQAAASHFAPRSLDLVFIDGDHARDAVAQDLQLWYPRVRQGGLLVGHDLFNPAYEGVLEALLHHINETSSASPTSDSKQVIHFAADYVWWLQL